jgi:protein KTI12
MILIQYFLDSSKEKELRGSLKSEVQKLISKEALVILDSLNYIKGYRYELYCVSKLIQTPQCLVIFK